jgi:hypothetical protein
MTLGYARTRFAQSITVFKVRNVTSMKLCKARIQRQETLHRADKRFHFVLTEAVLRYRLCPPAGIQVYSLARVTAEPRRALQAAL